MSSTRATSKDESRFVYQIGQDFFWVEIWLYNFLPGYDPLQIPFLFVNQIAIEETLATWVTSGFIVLENDYELLERGVPNFVGDQPSSVNNTGGFSAPYLFRNDGRNRLNIKIRPYKAAHDDISDELPPTHWEMNYDFIIYDIQDVSLDEPGKKLRAYYFRDERSQIFSERCLEWSTSLDKPIGTKDADRASYGNDAIKSLISFAGTVGGKALCVGFDEKGSIVKPNIKLDTFSNNWAAAPTDPEDKIFYNSPGHHSVMDDLEYLLKNTKSSDNFPVLLDLNRYSKEWELISLSKIFKDSQTNQIEHLIINDGVDPTNFPPGIPRASGGNSSPIHNFISGTASNIINYHYSPMVADDDSLLVNSPLINYNFSKTTYNIFFEKNKVSNVLDSANKMVQNGLYSFSGNNEGQIQMNLNPSKLKGIMNRNYFTPQSFFLKDGPLMQMIKDLVFLSGSIYFQTLGITLRTPGKFVFIDRIASGSSNGFDDRFLGQWLITKVTHFFSKKQYINDVVATKIDSFSKIFPDPKKDSSY